MSFAAAKEIAERAVRHDNAGEKREAATAYIDATEILLSVLQSETDERRKDGFSRACSGWMSRAEALRASVVEEEGAAAAAVPPPVLAAAQEAQANVAEEHHPLAVPTPITAPIHVPIPTSAILAPAATAPPPPYAEPDPSAAELPPPSYAADWAVLARPGPPVPAPEAEADDVETSAVVVVPVPILVPISAAAADPAVIPAAVTVVDAICVAAVTATPSSSSSTWSSSSSAGSAGASSSAPSTTPAMAFTKGERVEYRSAEADGAAAALWVPATVREVHTDAAGAAYFTITLLDGREKQTVATRLRGLSSRSALSIAAR